MKLPPIVCLLFPPLLGFAGNPAPGDEGWTKLFNGKDLEGWTTVLEKKTPGEDPEHLAQVRGGEIHMYPDVSPEATVPFGVIAHSGVFSRFHLTLEYRWGGNRFAPRKTAIRDAGVLFHVIKPDPIWPESLEYQVQEGDTGDLVFIETGGLTWMRPDPANAPAGQGKPGMLVESGGFPQAYAKGPYIGRFPEYDRTEGWNRVDIIVQADEFAEYRINGNVKSRVAFMRKSDGSPLGSGRIALQLEGAEILYRDVRIRVLDEPLRAEPAMASLSAVKGKSTGAATIVIRNPLTKPIASGVVVSGADAGAFTVEALPEPLPGGESRTLKVTFNPNRGAGRYSAAVRVGDAESGVFIPLQGVGLAAFEGENEPALQSVAYALGIPLDVGGAKLELDTKAGKIGAGVDVRNFRAASAGKVRITPVARFSPKGVTPFGIVAAGSETLTTVGNLADSDAAVPDAHQKLFPPLEGGAPAVEFAAPEGAFGFFMKGHKFTAFTDPAHPTAAKIARTARVYPVKFFQNRPVKDAWLIGFEEASNGDYQDAVFLVENVVPAP